MGFENAGSSSVSIHDYAQPRVSTAADHGRDKRNKIAFSSVMLRASTPNTTVNRANKIITISSGETRARQVEVSNKSPMYLNDEYALFEHEKY